MHASNRRPAFRLMSLLKSGVAGFAAILILGLPVAGNAQEITGAVRGTVTTPAGTPATDATVTLTDTRTGRSRTVETNDTGQYSIRGLSIGGPYTLRVSADNFNDTTVTDIFTDLTGSEVFNIQLQSAGEVIEEITVTAAMVETVEVAIGPGTSFDFEQIQALPSVQRRIRDIVRIDPRVNVNRNAGGEGGGISCLSGTDRANTFTIDGFNANDGFGLTPSGTTARNIFPIPFDSVQSVAVEFAPIDVQYGFFTGCNINVVTRAGSNEFAASAFYLMNDDSITGDKLDGDTFDVPPFEDKNFGFDFSGPIIKDTLFFSIAYEETDDQRVQNNGPIGGGFPNEGGITLEDANTIRDILISQYDRDPGEIVRTLPATSERTFLRLDWNINDQHRLETTYVKLEESQVEPDDFNFSGFSFSDNFENEGTEQDVISARLFSNWTDNFSTEVRVSRLEVQDIQNPLGGGEAQGSNKVRIEVETDERALISGPGFFRSANELRYDVDQVKLAGHYQLGNHRITGGYELDKLDIFNLFIPNATGTIIFDSIADLQAGSAGFIFGSGSFTGNPNDAAAAFDRSINTFYIQDTWTPTDALTVVAGLRYDSYESGDRPIENPIFEQRYGFKNTQTFDGLDLLMPRLGVSWDLPMERFGNTQLRAGFGIFSGGDPTVHFANAYQNFGGAIGGANVFDTPCDPGVDLQVLQGGTFTGLPDCIREAQQNEAQQLQGDVAAVSPDFELPQQNRWNLGITHITDLPISFFSDWTIKFDYIYSDAKNAVDFLDITLTPAVDDAGNPIILPDGRPQFFAVDPLLPGCNATFAGPGQGFNNVTTACDAGGDDQDILMVNGVSGDTTSISLQLGKTFEMTPRTTLDVQLGYAYTDSELGNPVGSATAGSSYEEVATPLINGNVLAPSPYVNEHNIVLAANFKHYFFEAHPTSVGLFFRRRSGRPFSYAFGEDTSEPVFGDSDDEARHLVYVPTGPSDPNIDLSVLQADGTVDDFFAYLDATGLSAYAGGLAPRNVFDQPWASDLDIRIAQAIPLPGADHSLTLFFDIENVLNLIDDGDNVQRFADTFDIIEAVAAVDTTLSADGSQYVLENFSPGQCCTTRETYDRDFNDSVWRLQFGIRYDFGK